MDHRHHLTQSVCIHCGHPVPFLYTQYSPGNIKLEQCSRCHQFADTYLERDPVLVMIDLLLHRAPVFRHVLMNRSYRSANKQPALRHTKIDPKIARFGILLLLFEVYVRLIRMERTAADSNFGIATMWFIYPLDSINSLAFNNAVWIPWINKILNYAPALDYWSWVPTSFFVIHFVLSQYLFILTFTFFELAITIGIVWLGVQLMSQILDCISMRCVNFYRIHRYLFIDAMIFSSFGRLSLILMVIWDPQRLAPSNLSYVHLANVYALFTNAEALAALTNLPYWSLLLILILSQIAVCIIVHFFITSFV